MAVRAKISPAAAFFNATFAAAAMEGDLSAVAQVQLFEGNFDNETLRCCPSRKPRGPNLKMSPWRHLWRNLYVVYEQIPEPPSAAAVRQAAADKPNLVAPPHVWRGVDGVERGVVQEQILDVMLVPVI